MKNFSLIETETGKALQVLDDILTAGVTFADGDSIWKITLITDHFTMKAHESGVEVHATLLNGIWGSLNEDAAVFAENWRNDKYLRCYLDEVVQ